MIQLREKTTDNFKTFLSAAGFSGKMELGRIKSQKLYNGIVQSINCIIEVRDPYTAMHQRRVALLAAEIGKNMGLPARELMGIQVAALTHDVGKLNIPSEILCKPGRLSDLELSIIKTHPQIGFDILKWIEFPWPVADIVLQHHERMDGSGYPGKLSREDISIEARVLGVADVIEAIASDRPYRKAIGLEQALEEITLNKHRLYDGDVVDAALRIFSVQGICW